MEKLDCRGLACPAPVLKTRDLIEAKPGADVEVLVDNEASATNVSRFLATRSYQVDVEETGGVYTVKGSSEVEGGVCEVLPTGEIEEVAKKKILVAITTDRLGRGSDELGLGLMKNFIGTLNEMGDDLWRLVFLNGGVKLTVRGAETVPTIQELIDSGVSVLVCGTCLNYFELLEEKEVGETTNMLDIVTSFHLADKVINV